jgi:hypothetical protein
MGPTRAVPTLCTVVTQDGCLMPAMPDVSADQVKGGHGGPPRRQVTLVQSVPVIALLFCLGQWRVGR